VTWLSGDVLRGGDPGDAHEQLVDVVTPSGQHLEADSGEDEDEADEQERRLDGHRQAV
jgi:hypothetical protein